MFGTIFPVVWDKSMMPTKIKSSFSAHGFYSFNLYTIREIAFEPSTVTHHQNQEDAMMELVCAPKTSCSVLFLKLLNQQ